MDRTVMYEPPRWTNTSAAVTVGSTSTTVLAKSANYKRQAAWFVNDSDETMYLALGATAVMNQGIRLNSAGGSFELPKDENGQVYQGIVTGISSSGSTVITVMEL